MLSPSTTDSTESRSSPAKVNLRPTLILGLGGTGARIAVNLKARLVEAYGSAYTQSIRFLCFDTAKEAFSAYQPNHPERSPVGLTPGSEMIQISDVKISDLMRSTDNNPSIARLLPTLLQSTQIDQGAQQIRRLGRIALFYHWSERIKPQLKTALTSLRHSGSQSVPGLSEDKRWSLQFNPSSRLNVYIVCSICGGTGSGMFLDMAYLTRYMVTECGLEGCSVTGVLLLPEAFANVETTGPRLRANAYASLLDLEHYNRATSA